MTSVSEEPVIYTFAPARRLKPETAKQLNEAEPEQAESYVRGFLYHNSITELSAKIKAGKTTLIMHMLKSVLTRQRFLGEYETAYSEVLYLTEERRPTFKAALVRAGLEDREDLHIVYLSQATRMNWNDVVHELTYILEEHPGIHIIVIDTLSRWLKIEDENASAEAGGHMTLVELLASDNRAILTVRHGKKGEMGEIGESARGGTAYGGAVDVILELWRANQEGHANRRILRTEGRFDDDVPEKMFIDLENGDYTVVGEMEVDLAKRAILNYLSEHTGLISRADLVAAGIPNTTMRRALDQLLESEQILELKIGNRYAYSLA